MTKTKGLLRSLNRKGSASGKLAVGERSAGRLKEPTACERCGAVFQRRAWQRAGRVSHALLARASWTVCPACRQVAAAEGAGRVVLTGAYVKAHEKDIRARLANVAERAGYTQPERRIAAVTRTAEGLDVLTTSQRLAHRVVHEIKKAFRGRATYAWSDDGTLFATWRREDAGR